MSKLDELIRELCPDGVEYKKLVDAVSIERGKRVVRSQLSISGKYPVYQNSLTPLGYHTDYNYNANTTFIIVAGAAGEIGFSDKAFWAADDCFAVVCPENVLNRYIYHLLLNNQNQLISKVRKASIPRLSRSAIENLVIPIPPLDVQREIVRILDNFTNLTAELTAELTARKTQYSYYRDKLLTFNIPIKWEPMEKEFPFIRNGFVGTVTPYFTGEEQGVRYLEGTNIHDGVISDNEILYVSKEFHQKHIRNELKNGDILMVQSGHVGECAVVDDKYAGANCHALIIMSNAGHCNSRFVMHYLRSTEGKAKLKKITTGGTVKHILASNMKKFMIPVPPLDVQNRIVNVLDNFEKICSDLNIGLPAEIEARQKQYEYYRDKLLTFVEIGNTILSRAEQSRAEQSRAEQSRALIKLLQYVFGYAVVTLEDIAENCDSMRKPITSSKREAGKYPYYGASGIVDYVKDYIFDGDYLLVSEDGANLLARSTPIAFSISGKNWVNNHAHVLKFDCYETRRFVEFYLNSIDLALYISGGAQPKLNQKNLNRIEIPLPSQERQKYIVDILDRFDAICNDLTSGLPAEIEARQKQYEYYRDKLLTFKEVAAT